MRVCYVESHIKNFHEPERENRERREIDIEIICGCAQVGIEIR